MRAPSPKKCVRALSFLKHQGLEAFVCAFLCGPVDGFWNNIFGLLSSYDMEPVALGSEQWCEGCYVIRKQVDTMTDGSYHSATCVHSFKHMGTMSIHDASQDLALSSFCIPLCLAAVSSR